MADSLVLDANIIVSMLYEHDSLHNDAISLVARVKAARRRAEFLDFLVLESLSVVARRSLERKVNPPNLARALVEVESWRRAGEIRQVATFQVLHFQKILAVIAEGAGKLNANDALLVVLQRAGIIDEVATFDENLAAVPGFKRFA